MGEAAGAHPLQDVGNHIQLQCPAFRGPTVGAQWPGGGVGPGDGEPRSWGILKVSVRPLSFEHLLCVSLLIYWPLYSKRGHVGPGTRIM